MNAIDRIVKKYNSSKIKMYITRINEEHYKSWLMCNDKIYYFQVRDYLTRDMPT